MRVGQVLGNYSEFADVQLVHRLSGGGNWNETWLVTRKQERLVVRLDTPAVPLLGLDRGAELAVLRALADRGLGPEVVKTDLDAGLLVTRWIPGRACTAAMLENPRLLGSLGRLLRRLHDTVAPPSGLPPLDLGSAMARYAGIVGGVYARRLARAGARAWRASGPGTRGAVLSHNDPVAQNLLRGPRLRLIDWEFVGPADPLFDPAVVIGHHGLDAARARVLLAAARGRILPSEWRALAELVRAYRHLRELWDAAAACNPHAESLISRPRFFMLARHERRGI